MPLSINKLNKLLNSIGFIVKSIFTIDNQVSFLDIFHLTTADNYMLYIPSKYEIIVNENNNIDGKDNIFVLEYIDEKELDKIDEYLMSEEYKNIDIYLNPEEDITEKKLIKDYEKDIDLKKINLNDFSNVKDIYKQLSRFKLCVKNIKYKICIIWKNYLGCIRRDNDINIFSILRFKGINKKKMFIIVDLETLFSDIVNITDNIKLVRSEIYKILSDNQYKHNKLLSILLDRKNNISSKSYSILKKKQIIDLYLEHLEELLIRIINIENDKLEYIYNIKNKSTSYSIYNNSVDIIKLDKELENILNVKQEIISNIIHLRNIQENIILEIDKILFENIIMINNINNNYDKLNDL